MKYALTSTRGRQELRKKMPRLLLFFLALCAVSATSRAAINVQLQSAAGGIAVIGTRPSFSSDFGAVNGLGIGTPGAGETIITSGVSNGVLYTSPYNIVFTKVPASHIVTVTAYVQINFASAAISVYSCPVAGGCSAAGGYAAVSTNVFAPTTVMAARTVSNNVPVTASIALYVKQTNGAGAFNSTQTATIFFLASDTTAGTTDSGTWALTATGQNAVQLTLATAPGGTTIAPASDFSLSYGNVNAIGVGIPAPGLTLVTAPGGIIYATPYLIQPSFSNCTAATATISVALRTNFVHPAVLALRDSGVSSGPYTNITSVPTQLTASASSGANIVRYLGLFVAAVNGPGAYAGADSATLTYTMVVP